MAVSPQVISAVDSTESTILPPKLFMSHQKKYNYSCPCCGSKISSQYVPPRSYHICKRCKWEDCPVQVKDPGYIGPANDVSLNQARKNFAEFGVGVLSWRDDVKKPKEK